VASSKRRIELGLEDCLGRKKTFLSIKYISKCYDNYDSGVEDKHPFGLMNGTA